MTTASGTTTALSPIPSDIGLQQLNKWELQNLCTTHGVYIPMGAGWSTLYTVLRRKRDGQPILGNGTSPKALTKPQADERISTTTVNRQESTSQTANQPTVSTVESTQSTVFPSEKTGAGGRATNLDQVLFHLRSAVAHGQKLEGTWRLSEVLAVLEEIEKLADAMKPSKTAQEGKEDFKAAVAPEMAPKTEAAVPAPEPVKTAEVEKPSSKKPTYAARAAKVAELIEEGTLNALRKAIALTGLTGVDTSGSGSMRRAAQEWLSTQK